VPSWFRRSSEPPQQAVDVVALELGAEALAGAATELVEDLARLLQLALLRDL
jgi:hypothetical protein